jgi:hypothetical protein
MKAKKLVIFGSLLFGIVLGLDSCGTKKKEDEKPTKEALKAAIVEMEDSLRGLQANLSTIKQIPNLTHFELINRLLAFYQNYPEDPYAPECLDKVHMKYAGLNIPTRAMEYADTLLLKYPKYPNRAMVLESQGSNYDIFIQPRDTAKVRYYYTLLLQENPKMDKEKIAGIKDRLAHLEMDFDTFIAYKMNTLTLK